MNYNNGRLKNTADRLAHLFESEEGERILRLITQLSTVQDRAASFTEEPKKNGNTPGRLRVGTWEAADEANGRSFVRVNVGDSWHVWANVQRIPPKGSRRRVVLLGESVARGYFYDPEFNPALALQEIFNAACGPSAIQVVDLARTDLMHDGLQTLLPAALHLEPDALVIFSGNNWHPLAKPSYEEVLNTSAALRETGSWRGVRESCESALVAKVKQTLRSLKEILEDHRIPIVFVLPEFNLADWRTDCDAPLLLNNEETETWLVARCEAEQLLQGNQWEKAEPLGRRLMQVDQGTTAAGPNILAEVSRRRGDLETAKTFLEMARDASACWPFVQSPRCFSVIHQAFRAEASAHGVHLVDLPREFTRHLGGEASDRRLFLDYCHLTLEGIKVSMAHTAETLLPLLNYPVKPWKQLAELDMKVGTKLNAEAHFLAAVHNANWGQSIDVVRHHVRTALECDRGTARMMQLFLDFHIRRVPASLCQSFDALCQLNSIAAVTLLRNHEVNRQFLNTKLINAVVDELERAGIPTRASIESLMIKQHGVQNGAVNLVNTFYSTGSFSRSLMDYFPEFYKATTRNTTLPLVCDKPQPLNFALTMKVPDVRPDQTISLRLNGVLVIEIPATARWNTSRFSAPARLVRAGLNQIEIHWPMSAWSGEKHKEHVAESLEAGEVVEITPMFGLIHSLRVFPDR
jgi:hypothetical protein